MFKKVALKCMEMYVAEKMSLERIADYFYYNYNSLGLTPEQCQTVGSFD
jgi:hypothetical protein